MSISRAATANPLVTDTATTSAKASAQSQQGKLHVPLVDLKAQLPAVEAEIRSGWDRIVANTAFILGPEVSSFEAEFAKFTGSANCVSVANGTDAIEIACRALGIGSGDEVIVPANTFIATALGVVRAGATPVLVDVDPQYQLLDPLQVERKLSKATKAIAAVHLYGQMAPMRPIVEIANAKGLMVIEDCAQAHGAVQDGTPAGVSSGAAAYSFYPGKNLGAFGDAGAVVTESPSTAAKIKALRNYGSEVKYHHPELGFNSRLDPLQAVVLRAKLKHLARWNDQRRRAAQRYDSMLEQLPGIVPPATMAGNEHVWHLYVVCVPHRDRVLARLNEAGVGAGVHYPVPIHLQGAFAHLKHAKGDFPRTERLADEILSLPIFPEISEAQQSYVVDMLKRALV
jgi:dTDP-4-amino-4,6-dideoxygalactose transaminase